MKRLKLYLDTSVFNFVFADDEPQRREITKNFGGILTMGKTMDEIHKIREQIYNETKNLSTKEYLEKIHRESAEFIKKHALKLKQVEKKEKILVR